VYLYKWFLIRVGGNHPENGTPENGVQVALEGYTTSDLLDHEKFRTAPIEFRIEKCKLRTVDGKYILLMGAIDEQNTYDNGFPIQVIHLFLTGFPFNWDKLICTCYDQPNLNTSVLLASKGKEYAWQEKDETLNSDHSRIHMEYMGTGKPNLLDLKGKRFKAEKNISKVTSPRESLVRCNKKERDGSPHIRSLKRLKCGNSRKKSEPKVFSPFEGLLENSNVPKESGGNLSLSSCTASVKTEHMTPEKMYPGTITFEHFDSDDDLTESGVKLSRNSHNFSVPQDARDSVKGKNDALKYNVFKTMKDTREYKKQIDSVSFLVEPKLTQRVHSVTKESGSVNQTSGNIVSAEDSVHQQINKNKSDQSVMVNLHLEQFKNNFSSGEQTLIFLIPVSEFPDAICKAGKLISRDGSHAMRNGTDESSQASRGESCGEITEAAVKKMVDTEHDSHRKEIINTRVLGEEFKNLTQFPSNPDFRVISDELISSRTDGKGQLEVDCSIAEAVDFDFICMKEDLQNNDVNKQVNKSGIKTRTAERRKRWTDQSPELSEAFVCNQTTVNGGVMLKCNDIDQIASEVEDDMGSKHCAEIDDDFIHTKEDVLCASEENKLSSLTENHLNNDANKPFKQVHKSGTTRRESSNIRTRSTYQRPELTEASVCYQTTVNDDVMLRCNDIDATSGTNPYQVASEIEHSMASKHCTGIGQNCREGNGDGEEGTEQNSMTITEKKMQTQTSKRHILKALPPPLPSRRVNTTPEEVSKAFGLKTSRSGRLLVPPLANWCNQSIAYDMDGGIIAILDASSQRNKDN
ncbi:hypothetical protein KI387_009179, partial [Taxus chinensis]